MTHSITAPSGCVFIDVVASSTGTIEEVASDITGLHVGDRVTFDDARVRLRYTLGESTLVTVRAVDVTKVEKR